MFFNQEKIDTMNKNLLYISLFAAAMTSCSDKDSMYDDGTMPENKVSVEIEDFVFEDGTRANYTKQDDRFVFSWEKGDELGVFADKGGHQALFKVAEGEGSNTALIEGGDWTLRPNTDYVAYYPFYDNTPNKTKISVDLEGKTSLNDCDYMYSSKQTTDAKGNVNFKMNHLTCLVELNVWMPKMGEFTQMNLVERTAAMNNITPFILSGYYNLDSQKPGLVPTSAASFINLKELPTQKGLKITKLFMMLPTDMSSYDDILLTVSGKQMQTLTSASTKDKDYLLDDLSYSYTFKPFNGKNFEQGKAYSINVQPYEYVDLGLDSGNLWATCNIGADSETDCGYYFMWGELKPRENRNNYTNNNYEWFDDNGKLTKYNNDPTLGKVDGKMELDTDDDAAYKLWGDEWRIPTKADFVELKKALTWVRTEKNGVVGYLGTTKDGKKQIFFPAAGEIRNNTGITLQGQNGYYVTRELWATSTSNSPKQCATGEFINSAGATISVMNQNRDNGMTIRAVKYSKK